jgi:hypothetical protein
VLRDEIKSELTEIVPICRSPPRAALANRERIFEQQSSGRYVFMEDSGIMKDRGFVCGNEIAPFTREGR